MHPRGETASKQPSSQPVEGKKGPKATQTDTTRPAEEQKPSQVQQESQTQTQTQTQKKATFMEKMKGEAKVLLGKIEGKQEKVAEGERMKHPEGKAAPSAEAQKETQAASTQPEAQTQAAAEQKGQSKA